MKTNKKFLIFISKIIILTIFNPSFIFNSSLDSNATDKATTESSEILSTSAKDDQVEHSTIAQMAKLATPLSTTTLTPVDSNDKHTTIVNTVTEIVDDISQEEGSTVAAITNSESPVDATQNNVQEMINVPMVSEESDDVTTLTADTVNVTQEPVKTELVSESASPSIGKTNGRSRVVSKDDIESIRGRALNFNNTEQKKQKSSGVIYVTAPPAQPAAKLSKSFDDLSDVSMDNDGMDFHSSEHTESTAPTPLIHDSECLSKVR